MWPIDLQLVNLNWVIECERIDVMMSVCVCVYGAKVNGHLRRRSLEILVSLVFCSAMLSDRYYEQSQLFTQWHTEWRERGASSGHVRSVINWNN